MKKQRKRSQPKRHDVEAEQAAIAAREKADSRRRFLRLARNGAIALPFAAGIGFFGVQSTLASMCEGDLSQIGQGTPTIVQIHDPQCSLCRALQAQTRRALKEFDDDAFTYLVANIKTNEGRALAAEYRVPHVTLLLFDARGRMVEVVRGPTELDTLRSAFQTHLGASS